jgi:hypothetical protein
MSSPNTMMKGKISKRTEDETAGSLASSRTKSEFIFAFVRLSKVSCPQNSLSKPMVKVCTHGKKIQGEGKFERENGK